MPTRPTLSEAGKRLLRDLKKLKVEPPTGICAAPTGTDIMEWTGLIVGPAGTPWEGGVFKLSLSFKETYPNDPPKVSFITKVYHPNVYGNGSICLDILNTNWTPSYDVAAILLSIQSLLTDPNPSSPANYEASRLYNENRTEYDRRVRETIKEGAEFEKKN
ncbi:hypothetical protein WA158_004881 [Blastocystis sp. Blastoise]